MPVPRLMPVPPRLPFHPPGQTALIRCTQLERYQEERQMPLISRVEERAMKRGLEQGLQQGRQILQETVVKILQKRFESVSAELVAAINSIEDISVLKQLIDHSLKSKSLEEFEQLLAQHQVGQEN